MTALRPTVDFLSSPSFSFKTNIWISKILVYSVLLLVTYPGFLQLHAAPRISEFVALNTRSLIDEDGDSSDWIEIENTDDSDVSLEGWYLTDDPKDLTKWTIPAVTLRPNDFLIIFASKKNRVEPTGILHTNFTLQPDEFIGLVEPDGKDNCILF
jgi:hypothetical protein